MNKMKDKNRTYGIALYALLIVIWMVAIFVCASDTECTSLTSSMLRSFLIYFIPCGLVLPTIVAGLSNKRHAIGFVVTIAFESLLMLIIAAIENFVVLSWLLMFVGSNILLLAVIYDRRRGYL